MHESYTPWPAPPPAWSLWLSDCPLRRALGSFLWNKTLWPQWSWWWISGSLHHDLHTVTQNLRPWLNKIPCADLIQQSTWVITSNPPSYPPSCPTTVLPPEGTFDQAAALRDAQLRECSRTNQSGRQVYQSNKSEARWITFQGRKKKSQKSSGDLNKHRNILNSSFEPY